MAVLLCDSQQFFDSVSSLLHKLRPDLGVRRTIWLPARRPHGNAADDPCTVPCPHLSFCTSGHDEETTHTSSKVTIHQRHENTHVRWHRCLPSSGRLSNKVAFTGGTMQLHKWLLQSLDASCIFHQQPFPLILPIRCDMHSKQASQ